MEYNLQGKNCLITGASGGLGLKIATAFWDVGANLFLTGRTVKALEDFTHKISKRPSQQAVILSADLSQTEAIERVHHSAIHAFERIDVLINCAATQGPIGLVSQNSWEEWLYTMQVNLFSPILLSRVIVPEMAKNGWGKIINLSGGGAAWPRPNFSAYAVSKAALVRFTETLAEETKTMGIAVNCMAPGMLPTMMTQKILELGQEKVGDEEYKTALKAWQLGEGAFEKAVHLSVFLASTASNGITGKLISAQWDPWEQFGGYMDELKGTDIYTLRRIVPKDRGMTWGEK